MQSTVQILPLGDNILPKVGFSESGDIIYEWTWYNYSDWS